MPKIVAISDTHNAHDEVSIPECDILIHAGDESYYGNEEEIRAFAKWFDKQPAKHLVWTPGNHSMGFSYHYPASIHWFADHCRRGHILVNDEVTLEGVKIYGSPITPAFHEWAYNVERGDAINRFWRMIPTDTNVLVTHGPAFGVLDVTKRRDSVGCYDLALRIAQVKPKLHIFGHIHESYGTHYQNGTTSVNAAIMDESYNPVNNPVVLIYEDL